MGKIICEKHGDQGIVLTCEHVRQDILTGSSTIDCLITGEEVLGSFVNEIVAINVGTAISERNNMGFRYWMESYLIPQLGSAIGPHRCVESASRYLKNL